MAIFFPFCLPAFFLAGVLERAYRRPDRRDHERPRPGWGRDAVLRRVPSRLLRGGHLQDHANVVSAVDATSERREKILHAID